MPRLTLRCKMQDNGFRQRAGRHLTLAECRKLFECSHVECGECPVLAVEDVRKKGGG